MVVTFPALGDAELHEDDGCRSISAAAAAATVSDIKVDVPGSESRMAASNGDDSSVLMTMVVVVEVPEDVGAFPPDEQDVD